MRRRRLNGHLMRGLAALLPGVAVRSTADARACRPIRSRRWPSPGWRRRFVSAEPGNLPAVTGAAGPRVLGALYPAALRRKRPPAGGLVERADEAQAEKLSRSRRWWWRSDS